MGQDTKVQGRLCFMAAPGQLNHTGIWDGKDKARSAAPFTRGQKKTTVFPHISFPVLLKARQHLEGLKEFWSFSEEIVTAQQVKSITWHLGINFLGPLYLLTSMFLNHDQWLALTPSYLHLSNVYSFFLIFRHFHVLCQVINEWTNVSCNVEICIRYWA